MGNPRCGASWLLLLPTHLRAALFVGPRTLHRQHKAEYAQSELRWAKMDTDFESDCGSCKTRTVHGGDWIRVSQTAPLVHKTLWQCPFIPPAPLVQEILFLEFHTLYLYTASEDRSLKMVRRQIQRNRPAQRKIMKKDLHCAAQSNGSPVLRVDYERKAVVHPEETLAQNEKTRSEDTCTYCNALMFQAMTSGSREAASSNAKDWHGRTGSVDIFHTQDPTKHQLDNSKQRTRWSFQPQYQYTESITDNSTKDPLQAATVESELVCLWPLCNHIAKGNDCLDEHYKSSHVANEVGATVAIEKALLTSIPSTASSFDMRPSPSAEGAGKGASSNHIMCVEFLLERPSA
ncbi:uncharacterized protein B0I36DRAFT_356854 [Microdochium trichocladiopsis]|uniref:C2H2-type domain-containing protein n=1 Tax=Microdochium trichocladiopsis TaxID=1682393 RepID=A0A9P8XP74_9PEZI|nr:uncharacterized protein B0I36DRAFT_356854 [Microdochium trichocladiopsis]KAH7009133.1 hypothetical protein B0I36DRAFT_356854 [Microdochium trichocladiopsis]